MIVTTALELSQKMKEIYAHGLSIENQPQNTEFWNNPENLPSLLLYQWYTALPTVEPAHSELFKDQSIPEQTDGWIIILGKCMGNY